jgi:hypothetical protein
MRNQPQDGKMQDQAHTVPGLGNLLAENVGDGL